VQRELVGVARDGHCFYHCIVEAALSGGRDHLELRADVTGVMVSFRRDYEEIFELSRGRYDGDTFDHHVWRQRGVAFAETVEFAATAHALDIHIQFYTGADFDANHPADTYGNPADPVVRIYQTDGNHFELIRNSVVDVDDGLDRVGSFDDSSYNAKSASEARDDDLRKQKREILGRAKDIYAEEDIPMSNTNQAEPTFDENSDKAVAKIVKIKPENVKPEIRTNSP
jgi:hypothetical protein